MTATTAALLANAMKVRYSKGFGPGLAMKSPLIAFFTTNSSEPFDGYSWQHTYRINEHAGASEFGAALDARMALTYPRATITRSKDYVIVSCDLEAIAATEGKGGGALVNLLDESVSTAQKGMALSIEAMLTGEGGGARGVLNANPIANTIVLADTTKVRFFRKGLVCQFSNDDGTGAGHALRDGGNTNTVTAVNEATGTVTFADNFAVNLPSVVAGDFIFRRSDFDQGAQRILQGPFAWCPQTAPTFGVDNFFSMDRGEDVALLAGSRLDASGMTTLDAIGLACTYIQNVDGMADSVLISPTRAQEIIDYGIATQEFSEKTSYIGVDLKGIAVRTAMGTLKLIVSPAIPSSKMLVTRREAWEMRHVRQFPFVVNDGGSAWKLEETADAMQMRLQYYAQLAHLKPENTCHVYWT